jgi:hypothetical protein
MSDANRDDAGGEITEEAKAKAKAGPPPSDVYTIRATCKARGKTWNESYDIQTGNSWLRRLTGGRARSSSDPARGEAK